jgi:hypothetical protein
MCAIRDGVEAFAQTAAAMVTFVLLGSTGVEVVESLHDFNEPKDARVELPTMRNQYKDQTATNR